MGDSPLYDRGIIWIHLNTAVTAINRAGQAKLHRITINNANASTLDIYDSPTPAGSKVATINTGVAGTLEYGITLNTGLTVVSSGLADITIVYE